MTIYEYNTKQLKKYRIQLYNMLKEYNKPIESKITNILSSAAKDGSKILSIDVDGKTYRLNSYYNPIQETNRWIEQYNFNNANCVISFFGLGNGMFVKSLSQKIKEGDNVILYEPSIEIFNYVLKEFDISDILENEKIYIIIKDINDNEFRTVLNKSVDWNNIGSQMLCFHPYYDQIFMNDYKNFLKDLNDNNTQVFINRNTAQLMGEAVVKNTIHNFRYLKESNILMDLFDIIPQDIPAIIVSAGPSLDKNITDLKEAKNKSIIIATDRALDFLLDKGIEPDFIVTLDAIKPLKYFSNRENLDIPLLCKIESNQEILDFHKGRKIWYDSHAFFNNLHEKFNKQLTRINAGGSVATAAFSICLELNICRIILVGQDLAYGGKYTHAGGIEGNGNIETGIADYVEDIYGNMIPTRYDWKYFKIWFEDAISNYSKIEVIDATEGGAKIKGTKIMTLKDAIQEHCKQEIDCKKLIDKIPLTLNLEDFNIVREYVKQGLNDLNDIILESKELIKMSKKLLKACEMHETYSQKTQLLLDKISQINDRILDKPIYTLIDTYISKLSVEYLSNVYTFTGERNNDQVKTYTIANKIYEAIEIASKEIKVLMENLLNDIN